MKRYLITYRANPVSGVPPMQQLVDALPIVEPDKLSATSPGWLTLRGDDDQVSALVNLDTIRSILLVADDFELPQPAAVGAT